MDIRAIGMGLAFAFMWSSAFSSARIIVAAAPPLTALSIRFLISGLLGVIVARALGQTWRMSGPQLRATIIFGICQNALYLGLNFVAMQTVEAGLAAIVASSMPLIVAALGWLFLRERLPVLGIAGLVTGFAGVGIIMAGRISGGVDLYGLSLCIAGALALAVATLTVRGASSGGNILMIVGLQMLVGSAVLAVFAIPMEPWDVAWSWQLVAAFAYTTLVPGLGATITWFLLVRRVGAVKAASFHFLTPFLGVSIAAVVLNEALGVTDLIGVAIITLGIVAVQRAKRPA